MATKASEFKTAEEIRTQAEEEFGKERPRPEPPTPPKLTRPAVVHIGDAHAWIDVSERRNVWGKPDSAVAAFFIVHRDGGKDQRIEGELTLEAIDGFIDELARVKAEVAAKQGFMVVNADYEKRLKAWEEAKGEFARRHVVEWEREQSKKS